MRQQNLSRIICRGEQRSPVEETNHGNNKVRQRKNFSHRTSRGATQFLFHRNGRPARRDNTVTVISLMLEFFCRRMVGQCHDCHIPMPNYSGYIIVIFSNNSVGEEYRDAEGVVPYRCGGIIFVFISKCCNRGGISSTGERCSPLLYIVQIPSLLPQKNFPLTMSGIYAIIIRNGLSVKF